MARFDKPENIKVIVATDCGSTTTKAILIEYKDGEYRLVSRGEAPTDLTQYLLFQLGMSIWY